MIKHALRFSHSLGQNFIVGPGVVSKIIEACGTNKQISVLEIGTGIGSLTKELSIYSKKVVSVEIDKKLIPVIEETLKDFKNVTVLNCDFLKLDLKKLWAEYFADDDVIICANLPYYITSAIIMKIIECKVDFLSMTLMLQKEVANRICAPVGTRKTGAISAIIQYYCNPEFLFEVGKGNFVPVPKVDSAVIKLNKLKTAPVKVINEDIFFKVIKQSFSKRRKTMLNSLGSFCGIPKEKIKEILTDVGVVNLRPENLSLNMFAEISNIISKILQP